MDGVAVAVASKSNPATCALFQDLNSTPLILDVAVHWCLRAFLCLLRSCLGKELPVTFPLHPGFMVTYSHGDVDLAIQSLLVQFYPILLSTLLSVNRDQLSIFDAEFALSVSSSPLAIYLSSASVCDLCGIRTGLFKRIKSHRHIIRTLGALVPLLWTALSMIKSFSNKAFRNSGCGPTLTFLDWLQATIFLLINSLLSPGMHDTPGTGLALLVPFFVLLFRRRSQVWADVQLSLDGASRVRVPLTWVKCAWYVFVPIGHRLTKPNAIKAHYQPSTQVVYSFLVRVR